MKKSFFQSCAEAKFDKETGKVKHKDICLISHMGSKSCQELAICVLISKAGQYGGEEANSLSQLYV